MKKLLVVAVLVLFAGIAFGQTLQKGNVVGVHAITVTPEPGATMDQFMDFFTNKAIPAWNKEFKGVKFFVLKGERGEHENSVGMLVVSESIDARNRYWPEPGVFSDEYAAIGEKIQSINDELAKLGTWTTVYTSWVIQ